VSDPTPTLAEVLAAKDAAYARWQAADAAFIETNREADELRAKVQSLALVCGDPKRNEEERARALEELPSVLDRARAAHSRAVAAKQEREDANKANTEAAHRWQGATHVPYFDGR